MLSRRKPNTFTIAFYTIESSAHALKFEAGGPTVT
jgi:hypothetical protein